MSLCALNWSSWVWCAVQHKIDLDLFAELVLWHLYVPALLPGNTKSVKLPYPPVHTWSWVVFRGRPAFHFLRSSRCCIAPGHCLQLALPLLHLRFCVFNRT